MVGIIHDAESCHRSFVLAQRCDGSKPACGQCVSKGREEDCEYTSDTQGLTKTQLLEENISLLEQRIRELEFPSESTSVKLHNPQASSSGNVPLTLTIPVSPQGAYFHAALGVSPDYGSTAPVSPGVGSGSRPAVSTATAASEPTLQDMHNMYVIDASELMRSD